MSLNYKSQFYSLLQYYLRFELARVQLKLNFKDTDTNFTKKLPWTKYIKYFIRFYRTNVKVGFFQLVCHLEKKMGDT